MERLVPSARKGERAERDSLGRLIHETYATEDDLNLLDEIVRRFQKHGAENGYHDEGYIQFSKSVGGFMMQFFYVESGKNQYTSEKRRVLFPVAFPHACLFVKINYVDSGGGAHNRNDFSVSNTTKFGTEIPLYGNFSIVAFGY